jgi:hypothetical protein
MGQDEFDFSEIENDEALDSSAPLKEGSYHFVVEADDPDHVSRQKNTPGVEMTLQVLAGTESQEGKKLFERFYYPSEAQSDGGGFATKRIAKLARVLDLIPADSLGQQNVKIDWPSAQGRQFIAKVAHNEGDNKRVSAQIEGLKMWRVTDAEVAEIPKSAESLALMGLDPNAMPLQGAQSSAEPPAATAAKKPSSLADL